MYVATNQLRVQKGHGAELEERFGGSGEVQEHSGFLWFQLWKLEADEDYEEYLVVTQWESEEDHAAWTRSDAFRRAHSGPRVEAILGRPEFKAYEVRSTSEG
jgi:heme oxygenase (staphylobilin-producing)